MENADTHFVADYLHLSLTTVIFIAESDASVSDHDSESSLSESLGIKTLQARSMVLASFRKPPETESGWNLIWVNGKRFTKVNHAANIHRYALDTLAVPAASAV